MRNKIHNVLNLIGRDIKDPGAHMYHARDGAYDGGKVNKRKRDSARKALHRQRMRASGMTDDIFGSKEVGGTQDNPYERSA